MRALIPALAGLSVLAACSQSQTPDIPGDWTVVEAESMLTFDSVKNGDIDETHEISGITGFSDAYGTIRIELAMDSVESYIDIRNERMREHLFQTTEHPIAVVSAAYDLAALEDLEIGASRGIELPFSLSLRGVPLDLVAQVWVTRLEADRVRVESAEPVQVHALALELMDGIDTLQELAGLDSIARQVPVSFVIEFARN
ncbi:MAG: YceI family protein [Maricaulis sp.]|uniref:YceI family protein n=1 Tax=Maricaulis sp. TaxID=1486257 RepID=UPI001B041A4A|nr:YceI family protein [Maricaulis sp.]MBO6730100.1 YceI family protein [Maricaulis sp.]MBO6847686.1 YceI family protein [Maricaulis sp.]MBO6878495.1 YceI family protein [Maricaulis sp.]MDM7985180.1 YceI family protein [Maricaulis sp.]